MANTRGNLPTDLSSFLGRGQEVREVRQLFSEARLVSVIGPGGVGKSRLAVRVGDQLLRSFRDGVWLVELASVTDSSFVPEAVAGALGVPEKSGREPTEALRQYLADRELVIVLDNCEQLRDAVAAILTTTLSHAPGLRVLATSQEVLGLPGETVYQLHPLAVPDPGALEQVEMSPAIALFADRAAKAMHGFKVSEDNVDAIVELCRRLDGLPLAIELAAAHARYLSPQQMLEHIDDRFRLLASRSSAVTARHRSLKATVEWSWDLCSKPERIVWKRLSVFLSTFDLSAAEAVCSGYGLTATDVAEAVRELVDRSVLMSEPNQSGMRYRLLESIRDFGLRMLLDPEDTEHAIPEDVLRSRHLGWYGVLAGEFDRDWFGPTQHEWLKRLKADLPNLRSALSYAAEHESVREAALRLAGDLCFFWRVEALREGEFWLDRLLKAEPEPSPGRARALVTLAWLLAARGQLEEATAKAALAAANVLDPERVPRALSISAALMQGEDLTETWTLLERALDGAEQTDSAVDRAFALYGLGWELGLAGLVDEAERHFRESLALSAAAGDQWCRGAVQFRRALIGWLHDDQDRMSTAASDALRASRLVPDLLTCANAVALLGVAAVSRDDRLAARLFGAAERFWDDAGGSVFSTSPWHERLADAQAICRARAGATEFEEHYVRGRELSLLDAVATALDERRQQTRDHHPAIEDFGLTRRELEVLVLIAQGLTNKEIASKLVISVRTAESHVQHILAKTGFSTRSQLAAWQAARTQPPPE